ncbi:dihydroneopterin aldolase, partial [Streptococcus suis]
KVAGVICQELFDQFPKVEKIRLAIYKENPPIAGHYDSVGIELERERP